LRLNWRKFGDYSVDELLPTPHLIGFPTAEKTIHQQRKEQNFTSLISKKPCVGAAPPGMELRMRRQKALARQRVPDEIYSKEIFRNLATNAKFDFIFFKYLDF
jgi:hypothetical protein